MPHFPAPDPAGSPRRWQSLGRLCGAGNNTGSESGGKIRVDEKALE
jgi:hypothetical protein